uniref:DUF8039 domain-containing protein n=2 Tax=Oryza sativa subsp. japonica TaxID=39947 RepID=Q10J56_ORYSJ|nr:hypothetical protein [Oryza sativa Japonica Group]ABF96782.1 transposon protein, putative, CACTA, En/Spm sub-class [Oryza sativa Japonica Group]
MLETFTLPAGIEDKVKRWTLKKMAEQFQSFKGDLYQKYILKGQTPNFDTISKLRDHWDEFVAYKTGQQGEKDELSLALQTPEHLGRTRGKGVIPWKIGFKEDIHMYRSRMRSERDTEAKIADLKYRVSSYELSMQEEVARKVDERMAAHQSHDPQPTIPPAMVASGMAIPTDRSGTYHCRLIPAGYSKVEVELVEGAYEDLELDYPGGDGETHLRDTSHAIILWRKWYIILPGRQAVSRAPSPPAPPSPPQAPAPTPPQAPAPAPSKSRALQAPPPAPTRATKKAKVDAAKNKDPGYDCTQEELDTYVASEVRRQLKPRSPEKKIPIDPSARNFFRGMSTPAKEAIKLSDYERTLKKASSGKSKPVPQLGEQPNQEIEPLVTGEDFGIQEFINDTGLTTDQLLRGAPIERAEVKYMYELGKPLVKPEQLQSLPTQMYKFHQLYMEMSATGREMIGARIRDTDFLQGDDILWINFKGIYELYQLDALDVSIMSCWILMEIQRARRQGVFDTGFIDPRKVNVAILDQYPQATEENLVHLLKAQHYKTFILLSYNTVLVFTVFLYQISFPYEHAKCFICNASDAQCRFHWVLLLFDLEASTVNVVPETVRQSPSSPGHPSPPFAIAPSCRLNPDSGSPDAPVYFEIVAEAPLAAEQAMIFLYLAPLIAWDITRLDVGLEIA